MYSAVFAKIYEEHKMKVFSYVLYKIHAQHIAEDITADAFLKLFKELQRNPTVESYALAWVYRVASNLIIDYHRSAYYNQTSSESEEVQKHQQGSDSEDKETDVFVTEYNDVLAELSKEEQQKKVLEGMKQLSATDQEIIDLRLFQELPFKEIAVILESTEAAVKMKFGRAIEKLKVICNITDEH